MTYARSVEAALTAGTVVGRRRSRLRAPGRAGPASTPAGSAITPASADSVHTTRSPESSTINARRSGGKPGSSGTYPAPDFRMPSRPDHHPRRTVDAQPDKGRRGRRRARRDGARAGSPRPRVRRRRVVAGFVDDGDRVGRPRRLLGDEIVDARVDRKSRAVAFHSTRIVCNSASDIMARRDSDRRGSAAASSSSRWRCDPSRSIVSRSNSSLE